MLVSVGMWFITLLLLFLALIFIFYALMCDTAFDYVNVEHCISLKPVFLNEILPLS